MKFQLGILLMAAYCYGQTAPPAPLPTSALNSFLMSGAIANASATPHPGAFGVYGTPIASDKLSWSSYIGNVSVTNGKPVVTTQATTGIAQRVCLMTWGTVKISCWIIGALGPGQTGSVTSLALNAGGGVAFEHVWARWPGLFLWAGGLQSKVAATVQTQVLLSAGWSWK